MTGFRFRYGPGSGSSSGKGLGIAITQNAAFGQVNGSGNSTVSGFIGYVGCYTLQYNLAMNEVNGTNGAGFGELASGCGGSFNNSYTFNVVRNGKYSFLRANPPSALSFVYMNPGTCSSCQLFPTNVAPVQISGSNEVSATLNSEEGWTWTKKNCRLFGGGLYLIPLPSSIIDLLSGICN